MAEAVGQSAVGPERHNSDDPVGGSSRRANRDRRIVNERAKKVRFRQFIGDDMNFYQLIDDAAIDRRRVLGCACTGCSTHEQTACKEHETQGEVVASVTPQQQAAKSAGEWYSSWEGFYTAVRDGSFRGGSDMMAIPVGDNIRGKMRHSQQMSPIPRPAHPQ